jgi:hypothetical protein
MCSAVLDGVFQIFGISIAIIAIPGICFVVHMMIYKKWPDQALMILLCLMMPSLVSLTK